MISREKADKAAVKSEIDFMRKLHGKANIVQLLDVASLELEPDFERDIGISFTRFKEILVLELCVRH